jgi:hypothetical protein
MSKTVRVIKYLLIMMLITVFAGCAPSKKNTYYQKRKKSTQINTTQLGRNKYYFSPNYQNKLKSNYKKK